MRCSKCNTENKASYKYCMECGLELNQTVNILYCHECGSKNKFSNKFCMNCGSQLRKSVHDNKKNISNDNKRKKKSNIHNNSRRTSPNFSLLRAIKNHKVISTVAIIIFGYLVIQMFPSNSDHASSNYFNNLNTNNIPVNQYIDPGVREIASKFVCSCGNCGEEPLETCTCPTAKEERAYIKSLVYEKLSTDDIVTAVANKYGWLKSEYAAKYTVDKSKIWDAGNKQNSLDGLNNSNNISNSTSQIATLSNRVTIISTFKCPCGQCFIDELLDCDCNHINGAQEVKGFIDNKIVEGKYTVAQIIEEVDKKYGGRKI